MTTEEAVDAAVFDARDRKIARLERRVADAEASQRVLTRELEIAEERTRIALAITEPREPTPIRPRSKSERVWEAAAVMMASDWHVEERVDPKTVNGVNSYDLATAEARAHSLFRGWEWHINLLAKGDVRYRINEGLLWLGGDFISGNIHEELVETAQLSPTKATMFAADLIAAGIEHLLKETTLRRIRVLCNDGNHERTTPKIRVSTRADNSFGWLMYHSLALRFAKDSRVEFTVCDGAHGYIDVMGHTIRTTHGDELRYGGGIGGLAIPLRKALNRWNSLRRAHVTILGHFHEFQDLGSAVVNGSLIGFGPYSQRIGAVPEPASQGFFIIDKDRGKRCVSPVMVG